MSWFSIKDLAKSALNEAQKTIDKALDIQGKDGTSGSTSQFQGSTTNYIESDVKTSDSAIAQKSTIPKKKQPRPSRAKAAGLKAKKITDDISDDFFAAWGDDSITEKKSTSVISEVDDYNRSNKSDNSSIPNDDEISKVYSDSDIEVISQLKDLPQSPLKNEGSSSETSTLENVKSTESFVEVPLDDIEKPIAVAEKDNSEQMTYTSQEDESEQLQGLPCEEDPAHTQNVKLDSAISSEENDSQCDEYDAAAPVDDDKKVDETLSSIQVQGLISPHENDSASLQTSNEVSTDVDICEKPFIGGRQYQVLSPPKGTQNDSASSEIPPSPTNDATASGQSSEEHDIAIDSCLSEDPPHNERDIFKPEVTDRTLQEIAPEQSIGAVLRSSSPASEKEQEIMQHDVAEDALSSNHKYLELSEKTEVYEQQLINLSKKNAMLNEENDNLRSEIVRAREEGKNEGQKQISDLSESLGTSESSIKHLKEEKANLMKQLGVLKSQLASRMTHEQVQAAITEKEESIKGLMEEGEVLAKKHLQQNNLIKKLKSQTQEKDSELKTLREKVLTLEADNTLLKENLKIAQGQGKEERETSLRISDAYEQRERETQMLQEKLSQSEEMQRTLQVNLDSAYKEIGDLHKQIAEQESRMSTEWEAKEADIARENDLEKKRIISEQEHQRQLLLIQIMELNNSISRAEANANRKDEDHRQEVKELQRRIQESEGRNQDLSDNVTSATRPLLRQIENLHATNATQQRSWNAIEKTLNSRLGEAQADLLSARESERLAQSVTIEAKSKAAALDKQLENNKKMLSQQEHEISSLRNKLEEYKMETKVIAKELEDLKETHKEMVHKSRKERLFLENQLQMEKVRSEAERKKHAAQQEAYQREKDRFMWSRSEITSVSSNQIGETESVGSSSDAFQGVDAIDRVTSSSSLPGLTHQLSFESGRAVSMSNVLENLQTQVKLREGEIAQLRGEINMLEKTRSSMAEEIVRLTNLNEDMEGISEELNETKVKLSDVESRYSAILTMYGEKEEENEELKMDLVDVKAMYRQQINDLLRGEVS